MSTDLVGHHDIWDYLAQGLDKNNLSHAYLLVGEKGLGKTFFAKRFAQYIFCVGKNRPCLKCQSCQQVELASGADLLWLKPEEDKQTIPIEKIRQLKDFINLTSLSGGKRLVVVDEVDSMNEAASNALLKSLEEPPANIVFILIAHNPDNILATIKSRCSLLNFSRLNDAEVKKIFNKSDLSGADLELITKMAYGRPALAATWAQDISALENNIKTVEAFLDMLLNKDWVIGQDLIASELNEDKSYLNSQNKLASIMRLWQEALRDVLLFKSGANDYIRYQKLQNKLELVQAKLSVGQLLNINKLITDNLSQLAYNPNLRLMLESLIAQIINV